MKVKAMHIYTANISKTVTDSANITIAVKCDVAYGFSISIFIVDLGLFIIKDNLVSGTVSSQIFWHSCYCSITMQSAVCAGDYLRIVFG